jgi:hypothetical protein
LAVATILAQATLGGITVLFYLPVAISVSHACLAQIFFCLTVSVALFTRSDWQWDQQRLQDSATPSLRQLAAGTSAAVFLQLLLGAAFRHKGFGIGPHIVGAVVVTGGVLWLLVRILTQYPQERAVVRPVLLLTALLVVQLGLGGASYFLKMAAMNAPQPVSPLIEITAAHVVAWARWCLRQPWSVPSRYSAMSWRRLSSAERERSRNVNGWQQAAHDFARIRSLSVSFKAFTHAFRKGATSGNVSRLWICVWGLRSHRTCLHSPLRPKRVARQEQAQSPIRVH